MATISSYNTAQGTAVIASATAPLTADRRTSAGSRRSGTRRRGRISSMSISDGRVRRARGRSGEAGGVRAGVAGVEAQGPRRRPGPGIKVVLDAALPTPDIALGDITRQFVREWVADLSRGSGTGVGAQDDRRASPGARDGGQGEPLGGESRRRCRAARGDVSGATVPDARAAARPGGGGGATSARWCTCSGRAGCGSVKSPSCVGAISIWTNLRLRVARSVTLVDGVFEMGSPKNGKGRTVSLPAFVADLLTPGKDPGCAGVPRLRGWPHAGHQCAAAVVVACVTAAQLFPRTEKNAAGEETVVYDFKLHELRHTAASLAIQAGANIKALQNMLGHESAGLTLDRYGHLYGSDVEAVGVAINAF